MAPVYSSNDVGTISRTPARDRGNSLEGQQGLSTIEYYVIVLALLGYALEDQERGSLPNPPVIRKPWEPWSWCRPLHLSKLGMAGAIGGATVAVTIALRAAAARA